MAGGYYMEQRRKCKGKLGRFSAGQGHGLIGVCRKILLATVDGRWAGGGRGEAPAVVQVIDGSCPSSNPGFCGLSCSYGPRNMGGLEMLKMGCQCGRPTWSSLMQGYGLRDNVS